MSDPNNFSVPDLRDCWVYSSGSGCKGLASGVAEDRSYSAERYFKKKSRCLTALVQRILAGSVALFAGACVLALLVG